MPDVVYGMASSVVKEKKISQNFIMMAAFTATCFLGVPVYMVILICIGDWNPSNLYRTEAENMIYLQLFFSFLQVGLFSFGGGYAAMPLIQEQIVTKHGWLNMVELSDLISISQMTPGPIAINSATFVGNKIAGITGALVATAGCILPSCIIVMSIAYIYLKNQNNQVVQEVLQSLHPAVIAMIALPE